MKNTIGKNAKINTYELNSTFYLLCELIDIYLNTIESF